MTALDPSALEALALRVDSGSGGDPGLDAEVLCACLAPEGSKVEQSKINGAWCIYSMPPRGRETWRHWEGGGSLREAAFTTSLDAVKALIEAKLPGWHWAVGSEEAYIHSGGGNNIQSSRCRSPERALLAATLKALATLNAEKV